MQNRDILVPANPFPGPPGYWPLKQRQRTIWPSKSHHWPSSRRGCLLNTVYYYLPLWKSLFLSSMCANTYYRTAMIIASVKIWIHLFYFAICLTHNMSLCNRTTQNWQWIYVVNITAVLSTTANQCVYAVGWSPAGRLRMMSESPVTNHTQQLVTRSFNNTVSTNRLYRAVEVWNVSHRAGGDKKIQQRTMKQFTEPWKS